MPDTDAVSWTVVDDGVPVEPAEKYLAYLAALERSPNTVRAYALSLKLWFEFLAAVDVNWACVGVEDVARFVSWLRAPADNVIVLDSGTAPCDRSSGLRFGDLGEQELRDLDRPLRLFLFDPLG